MSMLFSFYKVKSILFPPSCAFCNAPTEEYYSLCSKCWLSIKFINKNICRCCGEAIHQGMSEKYFPDISTQCCSNCLAAHYYPKKPNVLASIVYDDFSKKFILKLKEKNNIELALVFAKFFHPEYFKGLDYMIPVPIHPFRLWQRTYNQSALLVFGIQQWYKEAPPIKLNALKRIRYTPKQKHKNISERTLNLTHSIIVPHSLKKVVKDKRIAVIDDVVASGATLAECKRALEEAGAKEVRCFALAQTL